VPVIPYGRPAHTAHRPKPIQYAITRPAVQVVRSRARANDNAHTSNPLTRAPETSFGRRFLKLFSVSLFRSFVIDEKVKKKIVLRRIANDSSGENSRVRGSFALDCGWIDEDSRFIYSTEFRRVLVVGSFRKILILP